MSVHDLAIYSYENITEKPFIKNENLLSRYLVSVSYEAGGFVSAQSDKNAGLYPDAVSTGREGRVDVSYEILEEGNYGAEFGTAVIENQKDLDKLYARFTKL